VVKISKNRGAWVKIAKIEQNSRQVGMFTYLIAKVFFPILVPTPNAEHLLDSTAVLTMQNGEFPLLTVWRHETSIFQSNV